METGILDILIYVLGGLTLILILVLIASTVKHILRNPVLDGAQRTMWSLLVILLPLIGALIYFGVMRSRHSAKNRFRPFDKD